MRQVVSLSSVEVWENLGDQLKSELSLSIDQSVRPYKGLGAALVEVALGTAQFFAHKRALVFAKGFSPNIENLIPFYIKEAYQVQPIDPALILRFSSKNKTIVEQARNELESWGQSLKKDTLFVVATEDHPITGELYNLDEIENYLNNKKIFFIRLSHFSHHLKAKADIPAYSVKICAYGTDLALAIFGAKTKAIGLVSHLMPWTNSEVEHKFKNYSVAQVDESKILAIESQLKDFCYPFKSELRSFDRLVLQFPQISGDRMIQVLSESLELQKESGLSSLEIKKRLWSPNVCYLKTYQSESKWWHQGPTAQQQKEMLVLSSDLLKLNELPRILREAAAWIRSEQSWKF
jgi:hypothetical protein